MMQLLMVKYTIKMIEIKSFNFLQKFSGVGEEGWGFKCAI